jgi:hypothetical protein
MINKDVFRQVLTVVLVTTAIVGVFVSYIPVATYAAFISFAAAIVTVNLATKPGVKDDGK